MTEAAKLLPLCQLSQDESKAIRVEDTGLTLAQVLRALRLVYWQRPIKEVEVLGQTFVLV